MPLLRTNSSHADFHSLIRHLDAELSANNGAEQDFYTQFNGVAAIRHVVLAYADGVAVGCGAFKPYDAEAVEIKRMYMALAARGQGLAYTVLCELEAWAREEGYTAAVLETGVRQTAAIHLYERAGYRRIDNYGQYAGVENSLCFRKEL